MKISPITSKYTPIVAVWILISMIFPCLSKTVEADETTFIIRRDKKKSENYAVINIVEGILLHDRRHIKMISEVVRQYEKTKAPSKKIILRLDYVEARALHLKGWIDGAKKLMRFNRTKKVVVGDTREFIEKWESCEGRDELDGLYNGVQILLSISQNNTEKNASIEATLWKLTDKLLLMEICEHYKILEINENIRMEKDTNQASFRQDLVFLSAELNHLKKLYSKYAKHR